MILCSYQGFYLSTKERAEECMRRMDWIKVLLRPVTGH